MGGGGGGGGPPADFGAAGAGPVDDDDDGPEVTRDASNVFDCRVEFQATPVVWVCFT